LNADAFFKIQIQETAKEVSTKWDIFFYAMVKKSGNGNNSIEQFKRLANSEFVQSS